MKSKEESSFLQGVESRLDSLFADDPFSSKEKDSEPQQATVQKVVVNAVGDARGNLPESQEIKSQTEGISEKTSMQDKSAFIKEATARSDIFSEPTPVQDKSTFISEIEKRFSAIFGEDDKEVGPVKERKEAADLKEIIAEAEQEKDEKIDQSLGDLSSPPSSILLSPLKDMKSIILSIEWEINDSILEQLEDEINKLYLLYTGDRSVQGFLRILRFLGRYIRVRGVRSNQDSINLLLYVYDNLENVMVSEGMTEAKKNTVLLENIKKYRSWVQSTDLEAPGEMKIPHSTMARDMKTSSGEPWERKLSGDQAEVKPLAELVEFRAVGEEPIVTSIDGKAVEQKKQPVAEAVVPESVPLPEAVVQKIISEAPAPLAGGEAAEEKPTDESIAVKEEQPALEIRPESNLDELQREPAIPLTLATFSEDVPAVDEKAKDTASMIKGLPPQEAFAYALEEIKRNFRSELDALKEEIRILKSARE